MDESRTVWDAHTHLFPPEAGADPRGWGIARNERHWVELAAPERGRTLQDFPDSDRMIADMDRAGVATAILLGWYWESAETCRIHNRFLCAVAAENPSRFIPFAAVQLRNNPSVIDDLAEAVREGCRGIGELGPAVQGYSVRDPGFGEVCAYAAERCLPIVMHVTEAAGRRYPGRVDTPFMELVELAAAHPATAFIFAHWGGGLPFYTLNRHVRASLANVYFDSAASPLIYDDRVWRVVRDLVGPERLLFGSDYPLRIYPRRQRRADFTRLLNEFRGSGFSEAELRAVSSDNVRRLLDLQETLRT